MTEPTELLRPIARQAALDRVDVGRLRDAMEGMGADDVEPLIGELVEQRAYQQAAAVAIAAALAGCPVDATILDPLAYAVGGLEAFTLLVRSVDGDVVGQLLDLWQSGRLSQNTEAMIAVLLAELCDEPPPRAVGLLRTLCRYEFDIGTTTVIGDAVRAFDDPQLNEIGKRHLKVAAEFPDDSRFRRVLERPIFEILPERAPRQVVRGQTVTKEDDVGRNDPCPCGSGRKYKKCCMRKSADAAGRPAAQTKVTVRQLQTMPPHKIVALELDRLSDQQLRIAFNQLSLYNMFDDAERLITAMEERGFDNIYDVRVDLIQSAADADQMQVAARLREQLTDAPPEHLELDFRLCEDDMSVAELDAAALEALGDGQPDEVDLAYALLRRRPALGILAARAAMSRERLLDAEMLAETIEQTRDRLRLSPDDRAQLLLDFWAERNLEFNMRQLVRGVSEAKQQQASAEAERLGEQYAQARRERDELQQQLASYERRLEHARHEQGRDEQAATTRHDSPPPTDEPAADVERLRRKIERLKGIIDDKNDQRTEMRQQISELQERLEDASADAQADEADADFDSLDEVEAFDTLSGPAGSLIPHFGADFTSQIDRLPGEVVRAAVTAAAELATADMVQWRDVKRLQSADLYARRLGRAWRMLFRLHPDRHSLEVLEVISRADFERAIKRYR